MDVNNSGVSQVFVCGGGHQGLSMAAHLSMCGVETTIWNRSPEHIREIIDTNEIHCSGIVSGVAKLKKASSTLSEVLSDFVMVATPSSAHKDVARELAQYVHKDMIVILNPGRTFGAIEFAKSLIEFGVKELPHIAETQTIVYTCRREEKNYTNIIALKDNVRIAALNKNDIHYIMNKMPECLRKHFAITDSILETSLSNVGMILHCAPVLMNIGWIESGEVDFKYYYDGISESIALFLEKLDEERRTVAAKIGCEVESVAEWMKRTYDVCGSNLYECIRNNEKYKEIDAPSSIFCRYILEDVPNGLVPVEAIGRELGVPTPNISMIVDLASSVLNIDFRSIGRVYSLETIKKYL